MDWAKVLGHLWVPRSLSRMRPALCTAHQKLGSCQQQASTTMARAARVCNRGDSSPAGKVKRAAEKCKRGPTWARPLGVRSSPLAVWEHRPQRERGQCYSPMVPTLAV